MDDDRSDDECRYWQELGQQQEMEDEQFNERVSETQLVPCGASVVGTEEVRQQQVRRV